MEEATTTLKGMALTTTTALRMGKTTAVAMNTNAPFVMNTVADMAATEVLLLPAVDMVNTIEDTAPTRTNTEDQAMTTTRMIEAMVGMLSVLMVVIEAEVKKTMKAIAIVPAAAIEDGVVRRRQRLP
ncbi:hypothetical protein PF005_g11293 [Phytophthora fragariae]|uniref:Uncharacterized protein n=1 Tax=Phytophthora fragariae TaxID=53985 RepID=A0A6A3ER20_9STRA|nr:hypothetical protein PF003_g38564 [Phytophthora fragariae]KAE8935954.1 hypothetical protein PF009_g14106 [Phytophthora fragariae]KAE9004818.1 hypothetical protein PF011_g12293 [Phytophthora fragariae]KAE9105582.1 hypothetical protein PF007_g13655 [Phytophthora fragariae]KAE9142773.1 hypothetical protein PF006_g12145 [Phytophthora fragariae]